MGTGCLCNFRFVSVMRILPEAVDQEKRQSVLYGNNCFWTGPQLQLRSSDTVARAASTCGKEARNRLVASCRYFLPQIIIPINIF